MVRNNSLGLRPKSILFLKTFSIVFVSFALFAASVEAQGTKKSTCTVKRSDPDFKKAMKALKSCGQEGACIANVLRPIQKVAKSRFLKAYRSVPGIFQKSIDKKCAKDSSETMTTSPDDWYRCWKAEIKNLSSSAVNRDSTGVVGEYVTNVCAGDSSCETRAYGQVLSDTADAEMYVESAIAQNCRYGVINIQCAYQAGLMTKGEEIGVNSNTCEIAAGLYDKGWTSQEYTDNYMKSFIVIGGSGGGVYNPTQVPMVNTSTKGQKTAFGFPGGATPHKHQNLAACDVALKSLSDSGKYSKKEEVSFSDSGEELKVKLIKHANGKKGLLLTKKGKSTEVSHLKLEGKKSESIVLVGDKKVKVTYDPKASPAVKVEDGDTFGPEKNTGVPLVPGVSSKSVSLSGVKVSSSVGHFDGKKINQKGKWFLTGSEAYFLPETKNPSIVIMPDGSTVKLNCSGSDCYKNVVMAGSDSALCKQTLAIKTGKAQSDFAKACLAATIMDQSKIDSSDYLDQFKNRVSRSSNAFMIDYPDFPNASSKFGSLSKSEKKVAIAGLKACRDEGVLTSSALASFGASIKYTATATFKAFKPNNKSVK